MNKVQQDVQAELERAVALHQDGKVPEAKALYEQILTQAPNEPDALHLLGVIHQQDGNYTKAIDLIQKALEFKPNEAFFHFNLGNTFFHAQQFTNALDCYQKVKEIDPKVGPVFYLCGQCLYFLRELELAIEQFKQALLNIQNIDQSFIGLFQCYVDLNQLNQGTLFFEQLIAQNIQHTHPYILLAQFYLRQNLIDQARSILQKAAETFEDQLLIHQEQANVELVASNAQKAIEIYQMMIEKFPQQPEVYFSLANCYFDMQQYQDALPLYLKTIALQPKFIDAYNNLGILYMQCQKFEDSKLILEKGLELEPNAVSLHFNYGNLMLNIGDSETATKHYLHVMQLDNQHTGALQNLAIIFQQQGKNQEALNLYETAAQMSNDSNLLYNYGVMLFETGHLKRAQDVLFKCIQYAPTHMAALAKYYFICRSLADWSQCEGLEHQLDALTAECEDYPAPNGETPFINVARVQNPTVNTKVARAWSQYLSQSSTPIEPAPQIGQGEKIRIGYLSNDFHDHATAHLMTSMLETHDKSQYEVYLFSYGVDDASDYRKRLMKTADHFIDMREQSIYESAMTIYEQKVDILVDLKGYSQGSRLDICSYRPAPIQISYLGFPGPIAADFIDAIVVDPVVVPESDQALYQDKVLYMPNSYQVNDNQQAISNKVMTKADFGIPEDAFVFASFNQCYKIEPELFLAWMGLLSQCEKAILWLWVDNKDAQTNLQQQAIEAGIASDRLIFASQMPKDEHLKRLSLVDVALDTFTYNGHTTTSDALYAGVPVVTVQGKHFASRVSASLLTTMKLDELICHSLQSYVDLAIELFEKPEKLSDIKKQIVEQRKDSALFDTAQFTRDFEGLLKGLYQSKKG